MPENAHAGSAQSAHAGSAQSARTQEPPEKANPEKKISVGALNDMIGAWHAITNHVKERKISVAMYLSEGYPKSLNSGTLSVSFPKASKFHKETLEAPECKNIIIKAIKDVTGLDLKLKLMISEDNGARNGGLKGTSDDSLDDSVIKDMPSKVGITPEPIINDALKIFGGEIESEIDKRRPRP